MKKIVKYTCSFIGIWMLPILVFLIPIQSDDTVRQYVEHRGWDPRSGIAVSFLYMFIPTVMTKACPMLCFMGCSFDHVEMSLVTLICILRTTAGFLLFVHYAHASCHLYLASKLQIYSFVVFKCYQKVKPLDKLSYCITFVMVWVLPIYATALNNIDITTLSPSSEAVVVYQTVSIMMLAECMYASHVERRGTVPSPYMVCAIVLFGCSLLFTIVKVGFGVRVSVDEDAWRSGFVAFGFQLFYLGYRLQEKRLRSDIVSRFEQVPSEDDDQLI